MMKRILYTVTAFAVLAAEIVSPGPAHAQGQLAPFWLNDGWRSSQYPHSAWYTGFAQDVVKPGANVADAQKRVANEAQGRMTKQITVNIKAESESQTTSSQQISGDRANEKITKEYSQLVETSTNAEVVKAELHTHYDKDKKMVYAFAAVKKSDLVAYYTGRIEHFMQQANNNFAQAKQFVGMDRVGSAIEKITEAKKNLNESVMYQTLLLAVDQRGPNTKALSDKVGALMQELNALENELRESATIHVRGTETMFGQPIDRLISKLQSKLSENKCRVSNDPETARYILDLQVKDCNTMQGGQFYYCQACVTGDLVSNKSGKSEAKINVTGPKEGWNAAQKERACERAFDKAVEEVWKSIRAKTEACK